jgi:hypothetical protein
VLVVIIDCLWLLLLIFNAHSNELGGHPKSFRNIAHCNATILNCFLIALNN